MNRLIKEITLSHRSEKLSKTGPKKPVNPILQRLKAVELLYQSILETSLECIIALNHRGEVLEFNPAAEKTFGYARTQIIGKPLADFIIPPHLREDHLQGMARYLASNESHILNKRLEFPALRSDGTEIPVELTVTCLSVVNSPIFIGYLRDITHRKKSEEKLQQVLEHIREVFWMTEPGKNEMIYISPAYEEIWGRSCESLYQYPHTWMEAIHPDDRERIKEAALTTQVTGEYDVQYRIIRPDGSIRWIHDRAYPVLNKTGEIYRLTGIAEDITEKRRMEEELHKIQKMESLGILAGGIAHDFNNILTAILGNISLAKSLVESKEQLLNRLTGAEKASLRASELAQQLLTFAKGGAPIKKSISIKPLIEHSVKFALTGSNVQSQFFFQEGLWPVEADEGQMNQVIQNLVINAQQAMPEGGTIQIEAKNLAIGENSGQNISLRKGNYLAISIRDQGAGISKEHLSNIFDPYFTTKETGSGLGLSITYSIIHRHQGHITVESTLGVGTAFSIYLPASSQAIVPQEKIEGETMTRGEGRVLVMDDDESILDIAAETLKYLGYEVDLARSGTEVVQMYKDARDSGHPFDIVIADLTVPGDIGGVETLRRLRAMNSQVKVIVSSGYAHDPAMADFKGFGFSDVLMKPYRAFEVSEAVKRVLNKK